MVPSEVALTGVTALLAPVAIVAVSAIAMVGVGLAVGIAMELRDRVARRAMTEASAPIVRDAA